MQIDKARALPIVKAALKEDIGTGDLTTDCLIGAFESSRATIVAKEECVVCGLLLAEWTIGQVDYSVRFKPTAADGARVGAGKELLFLEGRTASILKAERTMLNFLSFLSGVATTTRRFADAAKPYGVVIRDTRKTVPLLRYLEKYAVYIGGGSNHRMGLYDQVLIKDNHVRCQSVKVSKCQGRLKKMVEIARARSPKGTVIEIEVTSIEEFNDALLGRPDIIMLDNMSPREAKAALEIRRLSKTKPLLEVSGGITLDNVEEYARTKVDMISVGALTSSVTAIDLSLEIV